MDITQVIQNIEFNIKKLRNKLANEEIVLKRLREIQDSNGQSKRPQIIQSSSGQSTRKRRDGSMKRAINQALSESNVPLSIHEITQRVKALGVTTTSQNGLHSMVSSALRKDKNRFAKVDRGCYDLKSRQKQNNNYVDESEDINF